MELTKDQEYVFKTVMEKLGVTKNSSKFSPDFKFITIGGLAGTGKTFLISILRQEIYNKFKDKNIAFATFTGKASSVLKSKLKENNSIFSGDFCGTIHSLLYRPELRYDSNTKTMVIIGWTKKYELDYDLIFIDEASMVNKQLWNDLIEFNIPIIAVGDHGQLPPIGDQFSLMEKPEYLLTEIKRQALDNPIIKLSQDIRNGIEIPFGFYDKNNKSIFKLPWDSSDCKNVFNNLDFTQDDIIVLCGLNKTRVSINNLIRKKLGYNIIEPYPGERVVFLKNNYNTKVLNGMLGKVLFFMYETKNIYNMTVLIDGYEHPYSGLVYNGCFGKEQYLEAFNQLQDKKLRKTIKKSKHSSIDVCDFGYCISTHKSQGSEFKKVVCFIERSYYWDDPYMKRWLYTAVTRAKEKLFLIT
jgi:exodeoxyribonuclease V